MPATQVVRASGRVELMGEASPGVTCDSLHPEARGELPDEVEAAANAEVVLAATRIAALTTIAPRTPRLLSNIVTCTAFQMDVGGGSRTGF
ncbi:hypothetical protein [Streptomyces sp. ME19-01-6]|uniref:hypothetical protein n=1 Tax=Streptomyces sp. ME19-01-6 TaxID=3028686 RepID=UPI0029B3CF36|nr:hypothetical protein [Streptomyces sp. ME19-01-6]MDX3232617.1 hypothetical protein [Streptomyces sp. ME19-01-6]